MGNKIAYVFGWDKETLTLKYCVIDEENKRGQLYKGYLEPVASSIKKLKEKGYEIILDTTPKGRRDKMPEETKSKLLKLINAEETVTA